MLYEQTGTDRLFVALVTGRKLQVETDLNKAYLKYFTGRRTKFVSDGSDFVFGLGADNESARSKLPAQKRNAIEGKIADHLRKFCCIFPFNRRETRKDYEKILSKELAQNGLFKAGWSKARARLGRDAKNEFLALYTYTLENPKVYSDFNRQTRDLGPRHPNYNYKALYYFISAGMDDISPNPSLRTVYKGITHPVTAEVGQKFTFKCFTSASSVLSIAKNLLDNMKGENDSKTLFRIDTYKGVDIHKFSAYPYEKEVLIPPCETFNVVEVRTKNGTQEVRLLTSLITLPEVHDVNVKVFH